MSDTKPEPKAARADRRSGNRAEWEATTLREALDRSAERDVEFSTVSSLPIERLYTSEDLGADWDEGEKLDFRGDFYQHTLMTPFFDPGPNPHGPAKIFLAGVGQLMTEVAGELCDGFFCHAFTTEQYLREVTLPALERGAARAGRTLDDIEISGPAFVATGVDEASFTASKDGVRQQISFYGSTPAYRPVLEQHGWGELQDDLNTLSKRGEWEQMGALIDDDILDTFAVVAEPDQIADRLGARYGDVVDRISFYAPYESDPDTWLPVIRALHDA